MRILCQPDTGFNWHLLCLLLHLVEQFLDSQHRIGIGTQLGDLREVLGVGAHVDPARRVFALSFSAICANYSSPKFTSM